MAFRKGTSGNPGGRPRTVKQVQMLARKQTIAAIDTLTECLKATKLHGEGCVVHPDYKVRVSAAEALLSRGWGKPASANDIVEPTDSEKARILALQAQKLEAEIRLLEQDAAERDGTDAPPMIPGTPEYDEMLEREWGYKRTGRKDESDGQGEEATAADAAPDRRPLA